MEPAARPAPAAAPAPATPTGGEGEGVLPAVLESAGANGLVGPPHEADKNDAPTLLDHAAGDGGAVPTELNDNEDPAAAAAAAASSARFARGATPGTPPPPQGVDVERTRQFAFAIASLRMYNPEFRLTPEVVEIMRVFFDDLEPDACGTVSVRALFGEIERLDPKKEHVSEETRQLMWHDLRESAAAHDDRVDFDTFCAWVMRWKEASPMSVQNVYTSWAKQLTVMDFGLSEGDGMFVVPSEEGAPRDEELRFHLSALLRGRRYTRGLLPRASKTPAATTTDAAAVPAVESGGDAHGLPSATDAVTNDHAGYEYARFPRPEPDEVERMLERGKNHEKRHDAQSGVLSKHSMMTVSKSFVAGGLAGMVAKSALAPVDRIKLMFQVNDKRSFSFRGAFTLAKEIYVQDGFRALFRGNTLNIIRVVPYAGVQHSSFDFFRRQFHAYNTKHAEKWKHAMPDLDPTKLSNVQLIAAGSLAGGLSLTVSYPLDIVRARFMVQHGKHNYKSIHQAVFEMYRIDGARSFTRGLLPSLMGTLPYTGIGFTLNERFKHWMLDLQQRRALHPDDAPERLHPFAKLVCSYLAACVAQTVTYPMDTIRRRIQTDGFVSGNGKTLRYTGIKTTARIILANEGWRGFFKGVTVNWMRSPLATGISLTAYDLLKEVLDVEQVAA